MINGIIDEMSEALFPSNIYCEVCGAMIDRSRPYSLCDECVRKMHWITEGIQPDGRVLRTCRKCGKALTESYRGEFCYDCMETEHCFTRGWSCLTYGLHERELMMEIKYGGKGYLAVKMGDVLFDRMRELIEEAAGRNISPFDAIVPVPVSRERLRKRGYNQSELMAGQLVRRWKQHAGERNGMSAKPPELLRGVLLRNADTAMLRSMNPAERKLALRDAFGIKSGSEDKIRNRIILVIDDIYTTGATADACSRALLESGAEAVYLLTLCSGGNRKPDVDN